MNDIITRIQFAPNRVTIYDETGVYVILTDAPLARGFSNAVAQICADARNAQIVINEQTGERERIAKSLGVDH